MAKKYSTHYITINDKKLEVRVYQEWRSSLRYSIGKNYIILRMPHGAGLGPLMEVELAKLKKWATKSLRESPGLLDQLVPRIYRHGEELKVMGDVYILTIEESIRKTVTAKIIQNRIIIKCPSNAEIKAKQDAIRGVIIKLINKAYLPIITHRVNQINDRFFHEPLKRVSLKYNTSNWGSCSSQRNINLSSRLLLTNRDVIDYVIVHELSHLKVMDHSPAFWEIVEQVMPDYQKCEDWLDEFGSECNF